MKFVATEDIAAPIDTVWARVSDLEGFEDRIGKRVGQIARIPPGPPGQGTSWTGKAEIMGKSRVVKVTVATLAAPTQLVAEAGTDGMTVTIQVDLKELGPRLTRLTVTSEARARSLAARLMLQSAKLARQTMAKRYKARVADFASQVEKGA